MFLKKWLRVMSNLDPNRVRVRTAELMSSVSQLWTDLRSQHQPRTYGVRKGKQRNTEIQNVPKGAKLD